jgi:hypothetical protein
MATPPIAAMTPPPGAATDPQSAPNQAGASPSPPQPSPAMGEVQGKLIAVVSTLRAIAKAYPAASPFVEKALEPIPKIGMIMMQNVEPGEPQAGPTG